MEFKELYTKRYSLKKEIDALNKAKLFEKKSQYNGELNEEIKKKKFEYMVLNAKLKGNYYEKENKKTD